MNIVDLCEGMQLEDQVKLIIIKMASHFLSQSDS